MRKREKLESKIFTESATMWNLFKNENKRTTAKTTTADFWDPSSSKHQYYTNYLKRKLVRNNKKKKPELKKYNNTLKPIHTHGEFWRR